MGGGYETGRKDSYRIDCYNPVNNTWDFLIKTPYCQFALTTLNNKLLCAGGRGKNYKRSNEVLRLNAGQLKGYTKMMTVRSHATAAGHQGMLIMTGGWNNKDVMLSTTELFDTVAIMAGGVYMCSDLPQPPYWLQFVIVDNKLVDTVIMTHLPQYCSTRYAVNTSTEVRCSPRYSIVLF